MIANMFGSRKIQFKFYETISYSINVHTIPAKQQLNSKHPQTGQEQRPVTMCRAPAVATFD
jgi:hypothetical protein